MGIDTQVLDYVVCPKCKAALNYEVELDSLLCKTCKVKYPIVQGVPILLEEEANLLAGASSMNKNTKSSAAIFQIQEGPNQGETLKLPLGACCAIGRNIEDLNKTQVFALESTVPLDDFTKKMVMNYLAKKTGKVLQGTEGLAGFKRLPDLVLNDPAVSRLHAMIFHDESGVGVLDFVSRNGTFVNGKEVESHTLKNGDLIEIGATKISFQL